MKPTVGTCSLETFELLTLKETFRAAAYHEADGWYVF